MLRVSITGTAHNAGPDGNRMKRQPPTENEAGATSEPWMMLSYEPTGFLAEDPKLEQLEAWVDVELKYMRVDCTDDDEDPPEDEAQNVLHALRTGDTRFNGQDIREFSRLLERMAQGESYGYPPDFGRNLRKLARELATTLEKIATGSDDSPLELTLAP